MSLRARLTLWNVAVLAVLLAGSGALLRARVQTRLEGALDHELQLRGGFLPRHFDLPPSFPPEFQKQVASQQQAMKTMLGTSKVAEQMKKDDALLQDYIKKNGLTMQKTPLGVYYQVLKPGAGAKPKTGQIVSVNYNGTLLSGKLFDSSDKQGRPIDFPLGLGQVIPGWDEGIAMLNPGSKAILLIPSPLAYGERGAGADIPANAPLRFEVELVAVQ